LKSRREKSRLQRTRTFFCKKDNKHACAFYPLRAKQDAPLLMPLCQSFRCLMPDAPLRAKQIAPTYKNNVLRLVKFFDFILFCSKLLKSSIWLSLQEAFAFLCLLLPLQKKPAKAFLKALPGRVRTSSRKKAPK